MNIGVDLTGSDCSPLELFSAVCSIQNDFAASIYFTVFLDPETYDKIPSKNTRLPITFQFVDDVVAMTDSPFSVLEKKGCSQVLGMKALAQRDLQAFVSAGNTGALYVSAKKYLSTKPGISRPFLMIAIPVGSKHVVICDVGANMTCKAHHLIEFAEESVAFYRNCYGRLQPSVALLNVGVESIKGTQEHRAAYQKLAELSLEKDKPNPYSFIGNIEGRNIFKGEADVVITDGFSGNVFLKTMEGTADYVFERIITLLEDSEAVKKLQEIRPRFHYAEFSGAILAGVEGLVIKCHGDASEASMYNGIKGAIELLGTA